MSQKIVYLENADRACHCGFTKAIHRACVRRDIDRLIGLTTVCVKCEERIVYDDAVHAPPRAKERCINCGCSEDVEHVIPVDIGDEYGPAAWVSMCIGCLAKADEGELFAEVR